MAKSIRDVLSEFREHSLDERDKGARFEQLMKDFLQNDTQYQRLFDEVWLWSEYPNRGNRPDTGIDLVARERDTRELVAIQCKFYAPNALISKPDIDSFLASSSKAEFRGRIFISTSDNWGKNAEEAIAGQKPEVARLGLTDLDESSIDWSKYSFQSPQNLEKKPRKTPRPHQEEAIKNVLAGFKEADRGKLIMACGTGKTFTSLKLVERMFPNGGTVLFLVPSISLLSQALKEWTIESEAPLRSYAVCSDVSVGKRKNDEDLPITDLAFPATTNTERLVEKFTEAGPNQNGLTVIFSTYQSIDVVAQAQSRGIPEFDLIVCDEAHRTTGVTLSGDDESAFVKVHNQDFIKGKKRLYMTATPKVFSDASSKKAEEAGAVLADMGKADMFGEEFHRLGFGEAVERGILTDYKVLVLAVDEAYVARRFQRQFADDDNELKLEDAAKIVGCWNGLSKRSTEQEEFEIDPGSMKRAVAFARSIAESKKIASMFQAVVDEETAQLDDDEAEYLRCEVEHVDGSFNSLRRNEKLDWLRQEVPDNTARILSNARCLTEGVDVPALDAVMFLNPRDSQVDVVQAVGRVMRKLEGKKYGYVILPIGVPADMDPATALNDNKKYKVVWQVLQALRSHDERFDAMVNKIDLTKKAPQIGIIGVGGGTDENGKDENGSFTLDFPNFDQWRDAIMAKIVQKVGEKRYWENWASDIGEIASKHIHRIRELVGGSEGKLRAQFDRFVKGLQDNLNPSITELEAIEMLAQHLITRPVFDALFENYNFSDSNPVSLAMQEMVTALDDQNLGTERTTLEQFYESVRSRVLGIESSEAKQKIIKQLYEEFFKNAFKGLSDRLGIVYTPIEIVDFLNRSANESLQIEFGKSISDEGVHVLDPFTGTGTFIARLLQSGLIAPSDLQRKYRHELHANELVLLAYYVAAVNIEAVFREIADTKPEPFGGIILSDTFQMHEKDDSLDGLGVFPDNNARVINQKSLDIRVILGNPPYSAGQQNAGDNNQNLRYPHLDRRIAGTYVSLSESTTKTGAYDSYIRAIRWASDRVGDQGIVAFVTNNSFIEGKSLDGLRKALLNDFDSVKVLNLRGNLRLGGEEAKREGGNVFDVRVGVAVWLASRGVRSGQFGLHYHETPDYMSKNDKLSLIREAGSFEGLELSQVIPNAKGDWLNQRTEGFGEFLALAPGKGHEKSGRAIFNLRSSGIATKRDFWNWNYSREELKANVQRLVNSYNDVVAEVRRAGGDHRAAVERHREIPWVQNLIADLSKNREASFEESAIAEGIYRPFVRKWVYTEKQMIWSPYSTRKLFGGEFKNKAIAVSGPGGGRFSVFVVDSLPEYDFLPKAVFFPRYERNTSDGAAPTLFDESRTSAVSDFSLQHFSSHYTREVSADEIFAYVYGLLHAPSFVRKYNADLTKELPRVPLVDEFEEIAAVGQELLDIHLGFDDIEGFSLGLPLVSDSHEKTSLNFLKDGRNRIDTRLVLDGQFTSAEIPPEASEYKVGTKSPLEWVIQSSSSQYDDSSGIRQDPNSWGVEHGISNFLVSRAERAIALALKSRELIKQLPEIPEKNFEVSS